MHVYSSDRHGKMANRSPLKATENLPKPEEGKQDKQPENPYGPEYPKGENYWSKLFLSMLLMVRYPT
jgi:hypothetical protein